MVLVTMRAIAGFLLLILAKSIFADCDFETFEQSINEQIEELEESEAPVDNREYIPQNDNITDLKDVDFIVVGAGAAGAVVANQLAQVPHFKVMVIEAGTDPIPIMSIPGYHFLMGNSKYNWGYRSQPLRKSGFARTSSAISIKRGKAWGGTTTISGLRYLRGSHADFDQMVLDDLPGWSYNNFLPYYKKGENSSLRYEDAGYHGHSGPVNVEHYNGVVPQFEMMIEAHQEIGYPWLDFNGKSQLGISHSQLMSNQGRRVSTGSAFIEPIKKFSNVILSDNSLATQVLINDQRRAYGVIFSRNKKLFRVKARKEVILCGGAINTPQLLMLSGVGPAEELKKHSIPLVADLPVGQNLIDHPTFDETIYFNTNEYIAPKSRREHLLEYKEGKGMLTIAGGTHGISLFKTKYAKSSEGADLAFDYITPYDIIPMIKEDTAFKPEVYDSLYQNVNFTNAICLNIILLNPKSRGSITLQSNSAYDYPIIDLNHLNHPDDLKTMMEGVPIIQKLENTEAFKKLDAKMAYFHLPSCKNFAYKSKKFWECTIKETCAGGYHPFGTTVMGRNKQNSVVDHKFRVHGIKNLRVVDAGVLRKISGYIVATLMGMAMKITDEMKAQYGA